MTMRELKTVVVYLAVGFFSTGLAFFIVTQFIAPSASKEPPPQPPLSSSPSTQVDEGEAPPLPKVPIKGEPSEETDGVSASPKFSDVQTFLEPFIYDPKNRKDPFQPYVGIEGAPAGEGGLQDTLLPLQRFELNEIRLVGIIWEVEEPQAMFLDPSNTVHIIGKNERIGRNSGYIAVIREGEVVVAEAIRKDDEVTYKTTILKISR